MEPCACTAAAGRSSDYPEHGYAQFEATFHTALESLEGEPLFTTTADPAALWEAFISGIPSEHRQHYTCHACRKFIERFSALVAVDTAGAARPVFWRQAVPPFFLQAADNVSKVVQRSRIAGVHVCSEPRWGLPKTGEWTHLSVPEVPTSLRYKGRKLTDDQRAAELLEEHGMLQRALAEYSRDVVDQAVRVLQSGAIYRPEKALGVATWFQSLHMAIRELKGSARHNLIWRAVATAPAGFCHVKSTVINTLLDDILAGLPFESIKNRFAEKMHPLKYQRPQVAPSSGNIDSAQKLMEKMGTAAALPRRYARLEDLQTLWTPRPAAVAPKKEQGLFDHLREEKKIKPVALPPTTMTLRKFFEEVLPGAERMEALVGRNLENYCALVTAADPQAPCITAWGNPVSWYMLYGGSTAYQWNLTPGWVPVTALVDSPTNWGSPHPQHGERRFFILKGASPAGNCCGGGFFPENLAPEYREIRSTLEAFYKNHEIAGASEATACGICVSPQSKMDLQVRVNGDLTYLLDRWD